MVPTVTVCGKVVRLNALRKTIKTLARKHKSKRQRLKEDEWVSLQEGVLYISRLGLFRFHDNKFHVLASWVGGCMRLDTRAYAVTVGVFPCQEKKVLVTMLTAAHIPSRTSEEIVDMIMGGERIDTLGVQKQTSTMFAVFRATEKAFECIDPRCKGKQFPTLGAWARHYQSFPIAARAFYNITISPITQDIQLVPGQFTCYFGGPNETYQEGSWSDDCEDTREKIKAACAKLEKVRAMHSSACTKVCCCDVFNG